MARTRKIGSQQGGSQSVEVDKKFVNTLDEAAGKGKKGKKKKKGK